MTTTGKPLKHFCACGRGFTTSSGEKHHAAACPQEQARSAAYVARIEAEHSANMAAREALRPRLASEMPGWIGSEPPSDVLTEDDSWDRWPA